jgi:hypothetical protein
MAYAVVAAIGILILSLLWTKLTKLNPSHPVFWVLVAAIIVGPWVEEFWIAYNFDRLCRKDAGVFINKVMEVTGFYDDANGWGPRQLAESKYEFMESRDVRKSRLIRVERADDAARNRALAWYSQTSPGEERPKELFIVHRISDKEEVAVSPNGVDAWRVTTIDRPTARYHRKRTNSHTPVSHQVKRFEDIVVDSQTGEVLGRYTDYSRGPYWFFISLDLPSIECTELQGKDPRVHSRALRASKRD